MRWFKRDRTIYSCGNCRVRFKNDEAVKEHHRIGCPQVLMEREIAEHNRAALTARGLTHR